MHEAKSGHCIVVVKIRSLVGYHSNWQTLEVSPKHIYHFTTPGHSLPWLYCPLSSWYFLTYQICIHTLTYICQMMMLQIYQRTWYTYMNILWSTGVTAKKLSTSQTFYLRTEFIGLWLLTQAFTADWMFLWRFCFSWMLIGLFYSTFSPSIFLPTVQLLISCDKVWTSGFTSVQTAFSFFVFFCCIAYLLLEEKVSVQSFYRTKHVKR